MSTKALVSRCRASPRFFIPSGTSVTQIGIAINRPYKDSSSNDAEETTFIDCGTFGKIAEVISQYIRKGGPIHLEGRLRFRQWQTESQEARSKLSVIIDRFELVRTQQEAENAMPTEAELGGAAPSNTLPDEGNDIPF